MSSPGRLAILLTLALVAASGRAQASTPTVHLVDQNDPSGDVDVGAAIRSAQAGDIIRIGPGVWPTSIEIRKSLTIEGVGGARAVALDGSGTYRILKIADGAEVTIRGIRFQNAFHAGAGAALFVGTGSTVVVEDCVFVDNRSDFDAAGAHVRNPGSNLLIVRSLFRDNHATHNAGAVNAVLGGRLEIDACGFADNTSDGISGAVAANNSALSLRNSVFLRNKAHHVGAVHVIEGWASINNCTFDQNAGNVASVLANEGATVTIRRNIFSDEQRGAGLEIRRAAVEIEECNVFWSNEKGAIVGASLGPLSSEADPRFCNPVGEDPDLTLWALSPAAPVFSACGELVGAYPVTCVMPSDTRSIDLWDPIRPFRR